ncbi:MAG: hypothetical protein ACI4K8_06995 [Candidatus Fimenecus sp.]
MKQNLLQIAVTAATDTPEETLSAGKMYEHNATALVFTLEESLVLPEYRYYVEFVTVSGTARTAYLTPDENRQITVDLPVEITSQMTALCVFHIVQIAENGKTEQVIKAKTVRLYFSALENTDRLIDENHAFSVNQLLEAIRQNTFKGEKGDTGDAYVLTEEDRTDIAAKMQEDLYGLPLEMTFDMRGEASLGGAKQSTAVTALTVTAEDCSVSGVADIKVTVGKNEIAWLLSAEKYTVFPPAESNYTNLSLSLKPNTTYVLSKLSDQTAKYCYSALGVGSTANYFCHRSGASSNRKRIEFTTGDDGLATLRSTYVYMSEAFFRDALQSDWQGLTVTELSNSIILQQHFDTPLYAVSAAYADSFDFVSGTLTRRTAKVALDSSCLSSETPLSVQDGEKTAYRYLFSLPADSVSRICGAANGLCAQYPVMVYDVATDAAYKEYVAENGVTQGIFFGLTDSTVCVLSEAAPADFSAQVTEAPIEIVYATAARTEALPATEVVLPVGDFKAYVSPQTVCAHLSCKADISAAMCDLQARLTAIENKL